MLNATFDASWLVITLFVVDLVVRIAAIIIVPRNRRPTAAMAWLLAIYFIPFVGVFLFLLIGNPGCRASAVASRPRSTSTSTTRAPRSSSAPSAPTPLSGSVRSSSSTATWVPCRSPETTPPP